MTESERNFIMQLPDDTMGKLHAMMTEIRRLRGVLEQIARREPIEASWANEDACAMAGLARRVLEGKG